ncbi:hypothetical protein MMC18_009557 [Xylographa bjoerkii]|nr:hypothetical protein [Xylographa bjoerkii]
MTFSLATSASAIVVNGITQPLPEVLTLKWTEPPLMFVSSTTTANLAGEYLIGTATLAPGGPGIVLDDTPVSLASSEAAIVVNGQTHPARNTITGPLLLPTETIDGQIVSLNTAGDY